MRPIRFFHSFAALIAAPFTTNRKPLDDDGFASMIGGLLAPGRTATAPKEEEPVHLLTWKTGGALPLDGDRIAASGGFHHEHARAPRNWHPIQDGKHFKAWERRELRKWLPIYNRALRRLPDNYALRAAVDIAQKHVFDIIEGVALSPGNRRLHELADRANLNMSRLGRNGKRRFRSWKTRGKYRYWENVWDRAVWAQPLPAVPRG